MTKAIGPLALSVPLAVWLAVPVRADDGPYQNALVGERSLGLAGAFVAVADDPSAIFHNPGGLPALPTSSLGGSLWAIMIAERSVAEGYQTDLGGRNLEYSTLRSLPTLLSGVLKVGPRNRHGVKPHALGAALLAPHTDEYRFIAQAAEGDSVDRLEVRHEDTARWFGLSYGYMPRSGFSFGASGFLALRLLRHDETEISAREAADAAWSRASTLDIESYSAVLRLGAQLDLAYRLRAGLMFQLPGLDISSSADSEQLSTTAATQPTKADEGANLPLPWELRTGLSWLDHPTLITLDLSLFGPTGDASDPMPLVAAAPDGISQGVFVPQRGYRTTSLRAALGFELVAADLVPLQGGVFVESSETPGVPATSDRYVADDLDTFGGALSVGIRSGGYDVALGATALLSRGRGLGLSRRSDEPLYRARDVSEMSVMIFLAGGSHAVKRLVRSIAE